MGIHEYTWVFNVTPEEQTVELRELTETEANIIRYVAGYICYHLQRKFEHENHPLKKDLVLNSTSMVKFNSRGGLWHVRETVHSFFVSLEQEVQVQLKSPSFVKGTGEQKEKICRNIYESDDIKFYWLILSADFEIEATKVCEILLQEIIKLFVTVRGFAFSNVWIKKYKQAQKINTAFQRLT